jgi:hypothetical protein
MNRIFLLALCLAFATSALSQTAAMPKAGSYDYTVCFTRTSSRIDFSKEQFGYSYEESGEAIAAAPGSLFDGESVRCIGMSVSIDGKRGGGSLCEGVAKDGDRRLTRFWYDAEGKYQREQVIGTGKYDGMVTTGSVQAVGPPETIKPGIVKLCNRATGTYTLK